MGTKLTHWRYEGKLVCGKKKGVATNGMRAITCPECYRQFSLALVGGTSPNDVKKIRTEVEKLAKKVDG